MASGPGSFDVETGAVLVDSPHVSPVVVPHENTSFVSLPPDIADASGEGSGLEELTAKVPKEPLAQLSAAREARLRDVVQLRALEQQLADKGKPRPPARGAPKTKAHNPGMGRVASAILIFTISTALVVILLAAPTWKTVLEGEFICKSPGFLGFLSIESSHSLEIEVKQGYFGPRGVSFKYTSNTVAGLCDNDGMRKFERATIVGLHTDSSGTHMKLELPYPGGVGELCRPPTNSFDLGPSVDSAKGVQLLPIAGQGDDNFGTCTAAILRSAKNKKASFE